MKHWSNRPEKIIVILQEISAFSINECWFNCLFTLRGYIINLTDISACVREEMSTFLERKLSLFIINLKSEHTHTLKIYTLKFSRRPASWDEMNIILPHPCTNLQETTHIYSPKEHTRVAEGTSSCSSVWAE